MVVLDLLNSTHTFQLLGAESKSRHENSWEHVNPLSVFWGT